MIELIQNSGSKLHEIQMKNSPWGETDLGQEKEEVSEPARSSNVIKHMPNSIEEHRPSSNWFCEWILLTPSGHFLNRFEISQEKKVRILINLDLK